MSQRTSSIKLLVSAVLGLVLVGWIAYPRTSISASPQPSSSGKAQSADEKDKDTRQVLSFPIPDTDELGIVLADLVETQPSV